MSILLWICRQKEETSAEERVQQAVEAFCSNQGKPVPQVRLFHDSRGKPCLNEKNLHISVSHSGELWGCAVSLCPVGLDIQEERKQETCRIARRFFHPAECAYLEQTEFRPFLAVWAAKESYVKYTGEGITDGFGAFFVADRNGMVSGINGAFLQAVPFRLGYQIYICSPMSAPVWVQDCT